MKTEAIDDKRQNFKSLLFKLAVSQMTLQSNRERSQIYRELEDIYAQVNSEDFRHFYSDIFAVISMIDKDSSLGDLEILNQNMDIVRKGYRPMNTSCGEQVNINKQINKLYDHINLEIARLNYFKTTESRTNNELRKVSSTLHQVENNLSQVEHNIEKADDMQKQYVTILGIFASIVLAFTGGIAFSTSVLENISNSSIYRILLIALILAGVLINIIFILTHFIMEITNKKSKNSKYIIILNAVIVILLLVVVACWAFDIQKAVTLFQQWIYKQG